MENNYTMIGTLVVFLVGVGVGWICCKLIINIMLHYRHQPSKGEKEKEK